MYDRKVQANAHVAYKRNFYSAPLVHIGARVDLRVTEHTLEIYRNQQRISSHVLFPATEVNKYSTHDADVGAGKQFTPYDRQRVTDWANRIGDSTTEVINRIFESVIVDAQGIDPALAVLRLSRKYSAQALERACCYALSAGIRSPRYAHVHPLMADPAASTSKSMTPASSSAPSGYVRGADYYTKGMK